MVSGNSSGDTTRSFSWPDATEAKHEYRVLIFAPTGADARLSQELLAAARISAVVVENIDELCARAVEGCGAIAIAEEGLGRGPVSPFFGLLKEQPPWSDLPVTLITAGGVAGDERLRRLVALGMPNNVTVLERPFRPSTLISTLEVALRARRRQYEVRRLLTEIGRARDAAERANQAKDEFLAALSHELRTPLNPVLLIASEAARDEALSPAVRRNFEDIACNVGLEAKLIDDLLDITRISRRKITLEMAPMDVHDGVRAALTTTESDFAEKRLSVDVSLDALHSTISADPVRLQQILWNVFKNAAKFTPEEGHIRITTRNEDGYLVVAVADSGAGMESSELTRIFDAFVQGNHARPESGHRFGGLGLGLAISRNLMELHGGDIRAASEGPGKGSTFTLRFPLATAAGTKPPPAATGSGSKPPLMNLHHSILVVEDHEATRVALKRLLENRGHQVTLAASIAEAKRVLEDRTFDLLLSDLGLPDGSGHQLIEMVRGRNTRCIALSGYGMEHDVAQSMKAGFKAHLIKPIRTEALDQALAGVNQ